MLRKLLEAGSGVALTKDLAKRVGAKRLHFDLVRLFLISSLAATIELRSRTHSLCVYSH